MQTRDLALLARDVQRQVNFSAGARCFLDGMRHEVNSVLQRRHERAELLHASACLIDHTGFHALVTVESTLQCGQRGTAPARIQLMVALWRFVSAHRAAVAVVVAINSLSVYAPNGDAHVNALPIAGGTPFAQVQPVQQATPTHLLAFPMQSSSIIVGMLCLAVCSDSPADRSLGDELMQAITASVTLIAPLLLALPSGVIDVAALEPENAPTPETMPTVRSFANIIATLAASGEHLLISGPSGAGKSLLAPHIHAASSNGNGPFVVYAHHLLPPEQQLTLLLGSSNDARLSKRGELTGLLGEAAGGTLFIDDAERLSLLVQRALLQALVRGAGPPFCTDEAGIGRIRLLFAARADLNQAVRQGTFLADLYHRINTYAVSVPPLADRRHEIPHWAHFFANRLHSRSRTVGTCTIDEFALARLTHEPWQANLRELNTTMKRAYAFASLHATDADTVIVFERHVRMALQLADAHVDL